MTARDKLMKIFFSPYPHNRRFHEPMTRMRYIITYSSDNHKILRISNARGLHVYSHDPDKEQEQAFESFWQAIKTSTQIELLLSVQSNPNIGSSCFLPLPDSTYRPVNAT